MTSKLIYALILSTQQAGFPVVGPQSLAYLFDYYLTIEKL
jgi:hypothetical protein